MTSNELPASKPAYFALAAAELQFRADRALKGLSHCTACAVACGTDRISKVAPTCRSGRYARISSYFPHFGEESPISGRRGSGTIFFSGCNLGCVYCQNSDISHGEDGIEVGDDELARIMLRLQDLGCHNINLVSPSHVVPQFLAALSLAAQAGLRLPIVYNTGGYDSLATLRLLDGIVDIFMPDAKYDDDKTGLQLSGISHYAKVNKLVLREMHRQVGDLKVDDKGVAVRGLLVRHLVLPEGLAGTAGVARFIASELSRDTYFNVMSQYRPCHRANEFAPLRRRITRAEYAEAIAAAQAAGLSRGFPIA